MNTLSENKLSSGTLEGLKWIALVAMTADHANKYLFYARLPGFFEFGRIAFPLFGFVLAYNLARPHALEIMPRLCKRLLLFALIAQVIYVPLQGMWPLNIFFTFLDAVALVWLRTTQSTWRYLFGSVLLFGIGGFFVEYFWFGLLYVYSCYRWCTSKTHLNFALWLGSCALLCIINGNFYALTAVPLILLASRIEVVLPRCKWLFYAYYPLHLSFIFAINRFLLTK